MLHTHCSFLTGACGVGYSIRRGPSAGAPLAISSMTLLAYSRSPSARHPAADVTLKDVVAEQRCILNPNDSVEKRETRCGSLGVNALPISKGRRLIGIVDHGHSEAGRVAEVTIRRPRPSWKPWVRICYWLEVDDCANRIAEDGGASPRPLAVVAHGSESSEWFTARTSDRQSRHIWR